MIKGFLKILFIFVVLGMAADIAEMRKTGDDYALLP